MIVVADDNPVLERAFGDILEAAGYKVAVVGSGSGAIKAVVDGNVSTVLVDLFMPEMDGLETLLSVKKQSPSTSVVVMTGGGARGRLDVLEAAKAFGADGVIMKPFTAEQLVSIIKPLEQKVWRF